VAQAGASNILDLCYNDASFREGGGYCRLVDERGDANALTVRDSYVNLATQVVTGIDYTVRYGKEVGPGEFTTDLRLSQFITQKNRLFKEDAWDDVNGTINNPEWSGEIDLTYEWGAWRVRWSTEWVAAMDSYDYDKIFDQKETQASSGYDFAVPDYFLHDMSLQYESGASWSITAGVRNLLDEEPPTISSGYYNRVGNAPLYSAYDYLGREYFMNVSYTF
jgi:iron complex outermembrane receptor protein